VEPIRYGKQCEQLRDSYVFYLLNTSTTTMCVLRTSSYALHGIAGSSQVVCQKK